MKTTFESKNWETKFCNERLRDYISTETQSVRQATKGAHGTNGAFYCNNESHFLALF